MRRESVRHEFVEFIPGELEDGVVYISRRYATAAHNCCCGCGREVNNTISPTDYELTDSGDTITLHPSIGNWGFPCRSHYYIRQNKIIWLPSMTQAQIDAGRAEDQRRKAAYFETVNAPKWRRVIKSLQQLWRRLFG